jgi:hypothetical protein
MTTGSALPTLPQSVPRGRSISWLHWFASATACQVARPPVRIRLERPAFGDFYFQAFNGLVTLPVAGYDYNSDWTLLLAGLSPAGMAASFAARSSSTDRTGLSVRFAPKIGLETRRGIGPQTRVTARLSLTGRAYKPQIPYVATKTRVYQTCRYYPTRFHQT